MVLFQSQTVLMVLMCTILGPYWHIVKVYDTVTLTFELLTYMGFSNVCHRDLDLVVMNLNVALTFILR